MPATAWVLRNTTAGVAVLLLACALVAVLGMAQAQDRKEKLSVADFDMAAYLSQLSAEGKQRGYKEFVYKQTPQGELRIYFAMPTGWSPNDKRPALVVFFGGGWSGGNVFSSTWVAEHFTKRGVVVGLADYRVRKRQGVMLDKCAEDARSAVRWVRGNCKNLGVDPARIIAGGGSAGGHIAACTAIRDAPNSDTDDLRISCAPNGLLLYLYAKPLRYFYSGDKMLLNTSVTGIEKNGTMEVVKVLAGAGPEGKTYLCVLNRGPAVALGGITADGKTIPSAANVYVESVSGDTLSATGGTLKTSAGNRTMGSMSIEPYSVTTLIIP